MKKSMLCHGSIHHARLCWIGACLLVVCSAYMTIRFAAQGTVLDKITEQTPDPAMNQASGNQIKTGPTLALRSNQGSHQAGEQLAHTERTGMAVEDKTSKKTSIDHPSFVSIQMMDERAASAKLVVEKPHPVDHAGPANEQKPVATHRRRVIAKGASVTRRPVAAAEPDQPRQQDRVPVLADPIAPNTPAEKSVPPVADAAPASAESDRAAEVSEPDPTSNHVEQASITPGLALSVEQDEVLTIDTDKAHVIGWINIGYTGTDPADRYIGRALKLRGWPEFVNREIKPQLTWGARRLMLHNPFGITDASKAMPFSQFLEAKETGPDWVTHGFVQTWLGVTRGDYTGGEPVEVIGYIGSVTKNDELEALRLAGDLDGWNARAEASIAPLLEAGMSVAFDAGSLVTADHPAYALMLSLKARGVRVYIETYPKVDMPHLHQFRVVMAERYSHVVRDHSPKFPKRSELAHRATQIINGHARDDDDPDWLVNKTVNTIVNGDNVMTNINWLIREGWSKERLMERIEMQRYAAYD